ncbi:hypothetical protein MMC28_007260 [Mycoblastus sanguinarius]|nr:hypothetical protein [Mycoblastus sanguinarius]
MAPHSTTESIISKDGIDSGTPSYDFQPSASQSKLSPKQNPALLHRSLNYEPYAVSHTSGIHLTLSDGRTIIDACGGAAVSCIGHNHPSPLAAALAQMQQVSYVHTGAYTTTSAETLAHTLLDGNPYGLEKAFFVGSGSEAMDTAMKMARQYYFETGQLERTHFVARKQSWHGATIAAMSVGSNLPRKIPYEPLLLPGVSHVSPAYAYQYKEKGENEADYVSRLAAELETEFQRVGPEKVIAFIAEPVVGATTGCVPAPEGYFKLVRQICDRYGILLILDEVMCGAGRTGTFFAFEQEGVVPDIMTLGKGLGGGYAPIAGVLVSQKVVSGLRGGTGVFNHGHTYQAHPLSCAIAGAVQGVMKRDRLVEQCRSRGEVLEGLLRDSLQNKKYVGNIRGRGLFWGVEFVRDKESKECFEPSLEFGYRVQRKAFDLGVAIYPGVATVDGVRGDHVLLAPPYTVTESELKQIVEVLGQAYDAVENDVDSEQ